MYLHEVEYEDGRKINFFSVARPASEEQIRASRVKRWLKQAQGLTRDPQMLENIRILQSDPRLG